MRDADGRRSGTFGIYTSRALGAPRDDIWILGRNMGSNLKVSLHASGRRQVGNTVDSPFAPPPGSGRSRHSDTWTEPVKHSEGIFFEYALCFPTDHLSGGPPRAGDAKVIWIDPAPPGHCVEIAVCTTDEAACLKLTFNRGTFPVAAAQLLDRRFLLLIGRVVCLGRHRNEALLVAGVKEGLAKAGLSVAPCQRLLVGFTKDNGLRGWADYSVAQFLADAGKQEGP